jgi:asparagine synthase (glutamine-hydrolysing)
MCGFVGSIPQDEHEKISACLSQIAHRGPDERQVVKTPHATLGHARLSILDVESGHQPMQSDRNWIVFNGEIYNYRSLRKKTAAAYQTESDTEVILTQYQQLGLQVVHNLDGMFSFVIIGEDVFMARDPVGIKPLYYAWHAGHMYFASEAKALLPVTHQVKEFPAGYAWHSRYGWQDYFQFDRYRQPGRVSPSQPGERDYARIRKVVQAAVQKRLIADPDVPVGVSLSGGLDSSIVAALARRFKENLDTFVVGMEGSEDVARSQEVARFLGTNHHKYVYTLTEMLDALPQVIYHLESYDAALVRSAIPNYFLARLASERVKVILTGEGADELFAGYEYLRAVEDPQALHRELWYITSLLHNTNLQRTDRMTMAHGLEGRVPFLDREVIDLAFSLPPAWKLVGPGRPEKDLLRRAFADALPPAIVRRPKQKFSRGSGSMEILAQLAHTRISDDEFRRQTGAHPELNLRSKEELYYYYLFRDAFGESYPLELVGRTHSVTREELW